MKPIVIGSALKALEGDASEMGEGSIIKLMDAIDSFVKEPVRDVDRPFIMPVEDVFTISGRGTVVTGRVERGIVKVGEEIEIVGFTPTQKTVATGMEMFRKLLDEGRAGDNIGVLLRGTKREEVERGQVLAKPASITPHTKFNAEAYVLTKEEGGRHTPFFNGYRPQFYFRTTDVTGVVKLPEGTEMVMPGDNINVEIELITPVAMDDGLKFAIREGGRTVGAGVVTKINPVTSDKEEAQLMREIVGFACDKCKRKNYTSTKNRKTTTEKLSLKKFCASCRSHTHASRGQGLTRYQGQ